MEPRKGPWRVGEGRKQAQNGKGQARVGSKSLRDERDRLLPDSFTQCQLLSPTTFLRHLQTTLK